jgi:hypothetical protein
MIGHGVLRCGNYSESAASNREQAGKILKRQEADSQSGEAEKLPLHCAMD